MIQLSTLFLGFSDLLINLSAGWFGAVIIIPMIIKTRRIRKIALLFNLLLGIIAFSTALVLRSFI